MAKHTPGPWRVGRGSTGRGRAPTIEVRAPHESGVDQCVSTVTGIAAGPANARLIAAAPEMYEALKDLLNRCKAGANDFDGAIRSLNPSQDGHALIVARALLAKIEGE